VTSEINVIKEKKKNKCKEHFPLFDRRGDARGEVQAD
jgi:hypothetical protein